MSDDHYIKMLKDKEDKKKKEEEEKERGRRNVKRKQREADRERTEGSIERGTEVCIKGVKSEETSQGG